VGGGESHRAGRWIEQAPLGERGEGLLHFCSESSGGNGKGLKRSAHLSYGWFGKKLDEEKRRGLPTKLERRGEDMSWGDKSALALSTELGKKRGKVKEMQGKARRTQNKGSSSKQKRVFGSTG